MNPVLDFLLTRRSRPAKTLTTPVPTREELRPLLTAAARVPDHGMLTPWRFIVLEKDAMAPLAQLTEEIGERDGIAPEKIAKARSQFDMGNLAVVVVFSPKASDKVPEIEQLYSAGAVCVSLVNAALAAGWGANWLSSWVSHIPEFGARGLGLSDNEKIAGLIHIGTPQIPSKERPRPDLESLISWT